MNGVVTTRAGYTGGRTEAVPTYESVCDGDGHSEAVRVWFDPTVVSYEALLDAFWAGHQPRWPVRRKARSVVWCHSDAQFTLAAAALAAREATSSGTVHTAIEAVGQFYDAEEWQQNYLAKLLAAAGAEAAQGEPNSLS